MRTLAILLFALMLSDTVPTLAPGGTSPPPKPGFPYGKLHLLGPVDPMPSYPGPRKKG